MIAGIGIALVAAAFMPWGQAREVDHIDGAVMAFTVSFPGLGGPSASATMSDGAVAGTMNVSNPLLQLHNTNPGWIAILLGVAAVAAGAALLWAPQRSIIAIGIAVLGGAAGLFCLSHLFDLRATFGNPPNLADDNFSPSGGLIAAIAFSFTVTACGVWAYRAEARSNRSPY